VTGANEVIDAIEQKRRRAARRARGPAGTIGETNKRTREARVGRVGSHRSGSFIERPVTSEGGVAGNGRKGQRRKNEEEFHGEEKSRGRP
jgi:hypothetical protein